MTRDPDIDLSVACVGAVRRRPPLTDVFFDFDLRNSADQSRFLVLSTQIGLPLIVESVSVTSLEIFELRNDGRIFLGRFRGDQDFLALMLAADSHIQIRRLSLRLWDSSPSPKLLIEGLVARSLVIGQGPADSWFGINPESDRVAT